MAPRVFVLAGPNGAGKSTAAARLLPPDLVFVNADDVARDLPDYPSPSADIEAGRLVLKRLGELERSGSDFAIETTLSGRALANRITRLRVSGYLFYLMFV